jgi:hypothetical protein
MILIGRTEERVFSWIYVCLCGILDEGSAASLCSYHSYRHQSPRVYANRMLETPRSYRPATRLQRKQPTIYTGNDHSQLSGRGIPNQSQSPNTASSDTLLRVTTSARNFKGNGAAADPHPFVSLLLGQLPLRPLHAKPSLRLPCNLTAFSLNSLRLSLSSSGGKYRPPLAAGSLLDNRL